MARAASAQFVVVFKISLAAYELLYFLFSLKCDTGLLDEMHKTILCVCTILQFTCLHGQCL